MTHEEGPFDGNQAQRAVIEDSIAKAMMYRIREQNQTQEIHPVIKWLVGGIATFGSASLIGLGFWLVSSVSQMRETLARMDERQTVTTAMLAQEITGNRERIIKLEAAAGAGK